MISKKPVEVAVKKPDNIKKNNMFEDEEDDFSMKPKPKTEVPKPAQPVKVDPPKKKGGLFDDDDEEFQFKPKKAI